MILNHIANRRLIDGHIAGAALHSSFKSNSRRSVDLVPLRGGGDIARRTLGVR
jgi:hypothetical protein